MKVHICSPLRSYTHQQANVEASGATVDDLLNDLESQFPGIKFRAVDEQGHLRTHLKIFINTELVRDLTATLEPTDDVFLMQALSGG
jgi:sulfur-carrier protein